MKLFSDMMKETGNVYATIAKDGVSGDVHGFADTGSHMLNGLMSGKIFGGGIPWGKITAIAGNPGTGKTFILLKTIKHFLDDHPTGAVFIVESESAITQKMMINRKIDINRVFFIPVSTVEDFRNQVAKLLEKYNTDMFAARKAHNAKMAKWIDDNKKAEKFNKTKAVKDNKLKPKIIHTITEWYNPNPFMICVDSIGNMSSETEMANALEFKNKADMGRREKLMKSATRVITQKLAPFQVPLILTSHIYMTMEKYSKAIVSGGSGPGYTASNIVLLFKYAIWNDAKQKIGNNIKCQLYKGRFTKEGSECWIQILFRSGLSRIYGLVKPGAEVGMIEQNGAWFTFPNGDKVQGEDALYSKPEVFDDKYLKGVEEWIKDNYCYGDEDDIPIDEDDQVKPEDNIDGI